jgi:hypothetical protein
MVLWLMMPSMQSYSENLPKYPLGIISHSTILRSLHNLILLEMEPQPKKDPQSTRRRFHFQQNEVVKGSKDGAVADDADPSWAAAVPYPHHQPPPTASSSSPHSSWPCHQLADDAKRVLGKIF